MREQVTGVLVDLQFQDRVSQILALIERDIERLDGQLGADRRSFSAGARPQPIDAGAWLRQFESGYTTLEQHEHAGGAGSGGSARAGAGDITFF